MDDDPGEQIKELREQVAALQLKLDAVAMLVREEMAQIGPGVLVSTV